MTEPTNGARPTVKANFDLPVGGGVLHASAQVPAGRTTLTELLPIVQNLESAILGRIAQEAEAAGSPISCKAGCAACCRQMVPVSLFEAESLMNWIRTLPEERQAMLEERFHRALGALRDAGIIDKLLNEEWSQGGEAAKQLAIDYFHAYVACPFLEGENCGIYSVRPLSCREYLVTSPPALCQDPAVNVLAAVELPVKLSRVMYAFGREMEHDTRGWIPLVFLFAWGKGGHAPGERVAGTGEKVLSIFLEQASRILAEKESD